MNLSVSVPVADSWQAEEHPAFERRTKRVDMGKLSESMRNFSTVSDVLRMLGAFVLVASMSVFLLQGWNEGNDVRRYLMLLGQTGLLTAAGFALSHGIKEPRGARMFFGVALISVPANFTILSALLYSVLQWDGALGTYPQFATWEIAFGATSGVTFLAAAVLLIPVTMFCYAIMARKSAYRLTANYLLLNSLLLLPIRSSAAVGCVALAGTLFALHVVRRLAANDRALNTTEGRFALATLFIPIGIILFRSMYFYNADSLLISMLLLALYAMLRQASLLPERSKRVASWLDGTSLPVAFMSALAFADSLVGLLPVELLALVLVAVFAGFGTDIIRRTASMPLARMTAGSICVVTTIALLMNAVAYSNAVTALVSLIVGLLMIIAGQGLRYRMAIGSGVVTMAAGVFFGFEDLARLVVHSSWVDLAVVGASAIALGSLLERHGARLKARVARWFHSVK